MAHEAEKDPAFLPSISGQLDVMSISNTTYKVQDIKEV